MQELSKNPNTRSNANPYTRSDARPSARSNANPSTRSNAKTSARLNTKSNSKPTKYISAKASQALSDYLESEGYCVVRTEPCPSVPSQISDHPDLIMCRLGISDDAPIVFGEPSELGLEYPADIRYNAACTGKFFIHNLAFTAPELLSVVRAKAELGEMTLVDVKQGYAKCSTLIVDERSIITYDRGIAEPCRKAGMDVLLISPGHVRLDGYNTGFIGGCSGRINARISINGKTKDEIKAEFEAEIVEGETKGTIVFNGDLSQHPDCEAITLFIQSKGLECKWFEGWELTDIGSII